MGRRAGVAARFKRLARAGIPGLLACAALSGSVAGQDSAPTRIVSGAFAHINVLGTLDATYGGLTLDRMGSRWGFSGAVLIGRSSDGRTWVHLPLAGLIAGVAVLLPLSLLDDLWLEDPEDEEDNGLPTFLFELLAFENVHRYVPLGDAVLLAPYVGVLGLDGEEGGRPDGFMSLNSGIGLNVKLFAGSRFVIAPDLSLRHHWILRDPTSDDGSRVGLTASIRAGFAF